MLCRYDRWEKCDQALASSNTYLRRYTLTAGLGIATADEDIDGRLPEETKEEKDQQRSNEGNLRLYPDHKFKKMLSGTWGQRSQLVVALIKRSLIS